MHRVSCAKIIYDIKISSSYFVDIFLTMTLNANDPDIQENLKDGVPSHYDPALVARVAKLKFKQLRDEVIRKGRLKFYFSVIEC